MHSSIISFGQYIPSKRIKTEEIARSHNQNPASFINGLGVVEKTVPDKGEDAFTMAVEAGRQALDVAGTPGSRMQSSQISAVFVGSESHPYAVKPTSGMVASALECHPFSHCADLEFACKAGTAGMQIVDSMVRSGQIEYGMAIGSDTAQGKPGDALEYTAAAGAGAVIIGPGNDKNAICRIEKTLSFTTDTPDFWRASDKKYPEHAGRFTGGPAYFRHVEEALKGILEVTELKASNVDHFIFHMPNAKFPSKVAKKYNLTREQMEHGFIVPEIGNTYSACSILGLINVLQHAKKDDKIVLVSYGSGAGSDAFVFTMLKDGIPLPFDNREKEYIEYSDYLRCTS